MNKTDVILKNVTEWLEREPSKQEKEAFISAFDAIGVSEDIYRSVYFILFNEYPQSTRFPY